MNPAGSYGSTAAPRSHWLVALRAGNWKARPWHCWKDHGEQRNTKKGTAHITQRFKAGVSSFENFRLVSRTWQADGRGGISKHTGLLRHFTLTPGFWATLAKVASDLPVLFFRFAKGYPIRSLRWRGGLVRQCSGSAAVRSAVLCNRLLYSRLATVPTLPPPVPVRVHGARPGPVPPAAPAHAPRSRIAPYGWPRSGGRVHVRSHSR